MSQMPEEKISNLEYTEFHLYKKKCKEIMIVHINTVVKKKKKKKIERKEKKRTNRDPGMYWKTVKSIYKDYYLKILNFLDLELFFFI